MNRCFFSRWAISNAADSGTPLSSRARQHLDGCARCQEFQQRVTTLGARLAMARGDAPRPDLMPAPRRFLGRGLAGLAAAAAVTAVVAAVYLVGEPTTPQEASQGREQGSVAASNTAPAAPELISPDEIDTLARDAEQGLRYVLRVSGLPARERH